MNIVLMYHRVTETDFDPHNLAVSPSHFREHLSVLRKFTSPCHLIDIVDNWSECNSFVAVTFDDGYSDNLYEALPSLEAEEIPATIFVSTGMLDKNGFWIDRLARCLLTDKEYPDVEMLEIEGRKIRMDLRTAEDRKAAHCYLHKSLKNLHPEEIEVKISELANSLKIDPSPPACDRPLTSKEAAKLVSHSLINLGGHTVYHPCLSQLKLSEQRWEIETCKATLHELGAPKLLAFAYPFGDRESYNFITRRLVRQTGWHHAVTSEPKQGLWFRRYAVPRHFVGDWDGDGFERRLRSWLGSD